MSSGCFLYFQFLQQLPKISSITLVLWISKLRHRKITLNLVSWSESQDASKLESEARPEDFSAWSFLSVHMLLYLAQMLLSF